MPCGGSWLKLRPAVPKAKSMSRISTSWRRCCATAQATLCAMVEAPAPPLAEMKPTVRPIGAAPSAAKSSVIAETIACALGGQHDVFGDARADQLAIEHDVVDVAEDDQPGRRVADLGEALERAGNFVGRQRGLDDDQVRRRVGLVGLDRAVEAAIVRRQRDLGHAAVVDRRLRPAGPSASARRRPGW